MANTPLLLLFIYSGFTMNILLQCGLGIKGTVESKSNLNMAAFIKLALIFSSIILLWLFFSKVLFSVFSGIFAYVVLFPISAFVYNGLEFLIFHYIYKNKENTETFINFPDGITAVCVFICINIADNINEALTLSFGFTFGIFLVNMIIREIRRRAELETVPVFLRGKPLVLIAMGMLSLIFTAASLLFFRMISAG
jgi:Na+-translocating ferredoxin:NAD+ oxidoreductase subunit A